jgi:hypothetical protein
VAWRLEGAEFIFTYLHMVSFCMILLLILVLVLLLLVLLCLVVVVCYEFVSCVKLLFVHIPRV